MNFLLLPVKDPLFAKKRLSELLSPGQRERLARLMFAQTLETILRARGFDRVLVASCDTEILRAATDAGAGAMPEEVQNGHSPSVEQAASRCMLQGASALTLVPIDVPLLQACELELLLETAMKMPRPGLVIAPSFDGTGTNALVRTPPDVIESCFGPDSFAIHVGRARDRKAALEVVRPPGLLFDLDTPADVARFLAGGPAGPVADFLRSCGPFRASSA